MYNNKEKLITVNGGRALEQVKRNREKHEVEYILALEFYKKKLAAKLLQQLNKLKDSKDAFTVNLGKLATPPRNHLKDYDLHIDVMVWEQGELINLTLTEFNNIIRNNWDWSNDWNKTVVFLSDIDDLSPNYDGEDDCPITF